MHRHFSYLILTSIFLVSLPILVLSDDDPNQELVLIQALWRHGDRAPLGTFKSDRWQEDTWPQGWGELTPRGMKQHVVLGKKLRKRYIEELQFVHSEYRNNEIYVRSTDRNRTLISAISNLIGFYGPGPESAYPKELGDDWPGWFMPIPVHTENHSQDRIAIMESCKRDEAAKELLKQTPEYAEFIRKYQGHLDFLSETTGRKFDLFNVWFIWDIFNVEDLYNLTLVDWARENATLRNMITEMNDVRGRLRSGLGFADFQGVNFAQEMGRMHGGDVLWTLIGNMEDKLACQQRVNAVRVEDREMKLRTSPLGTPLCRWINKMRYFAYSAHDDTIVALFAAFGFNKTDYDRDGYPGYTACITLELWRDRKSGELSVKVHYWRPEEKAHQEITGDIGGCPSDRPCCLAQFIERSKPYQMVPNREEYCKIPLVDSDPKNSANSPMMDGFLRTLLTFPLLIGISLLVL